MSLHLDWLLLLPSLPTEPSRHRVAVWRELRRVGAAPLGSGTWVLPDLPPFSAGVARVRELAVREGGQVAILDAQPRDEAADAVLRDAFRRVREEEWSELSDDCGKFLREIDKEFARRKFTLGELDEEERSMDRLRRWSDDLSARDVLELPDAGGVATLLRRCETRLSEYAERVMGEVTGAGNVEDEVASA